MDKKKNGFTETARLQTLGSEILPGSPHNIYEIETSSDHRQCNEDLCYSSISYAWYRDQGCHVQFICPKLHEKPCERFGLQLVQFNRTNLDVCEENVAYQVQLESQAELTISLWYTSSAVFHLDCFMWCQSENSLGEGYTLPIQEKPSSLNTSIGHAEDDIALGMVSYTYSSMP